MEDLTDKQKRFCEEYLIDLNATQAAIRAGYSKDTARSTGSENLSKPDIVDYIASLQESRSERTKITADMVLQELAKIGFSDIKNYYSEDKEPIDITQLENKLTAAVAQIKVTETSGDWGTKVTKEFKLHDKISALEKIARHIGFFEQDNKQRQDRKQVFVIGDTEIEL